MASGLGIDLGANAIKAVKVRRRGGTWQVLRACRVPDPTPPPPPVKPGKVQALPPRVLPGSTRSDLRRAGISGSGAVGLTGRDLMVKYVTTPPVPPWKLQMMMDLEIKGTSGAEVCGDFAGLDIPGDLTHEMVALVAVGRTDYVERQMGLAKEAGLSAEWCCPNAVALFNAFLASAQFRPGETAAILDIGRDNLDLVIQDNGVLFFARSASGGGRQFTDAIDDTLGLGYEKAERYKCGRAAIHVGETGGVEPSQMKISGALCEVADGLAGALRSATMFCKSQAKLTRLDVERIVLSGGGSRLEGLSEYLAKKTGLPVDVMDPASRMDISSLPADQQALFEGGVGAEMSVALGLAMAAADEGLFHLEVMPDAIIKQRKFWRGTAWAIAAGVMLAGLMAVNIVSADRRKDHAEGINEELKQATAGLKKKLKEVNKEAKQNRRLVRRAEMLAGPAQRNVPLLGFLKLLREVTPKGIVLTELDASPPETGAKVSQVEVTVKGWANKDVVVEKDAFIALENYCKKLQAESAKLAFKIDKPETKTGDEGDRGRPFKLTAWISTLGVKEEVEEPEGDEPAGTTEPAHGPVIEPRRPRPPRGLPSKPTPYVPPSEPKKKPAGDDDDGDGKAFDGGGRP